MGYVIGVWGAIIAPIKTAEIRGNPKIKYAVAALIRKGKRKVAVPKTALLKLFF